jgi:hypothetical protein
MEDAYSIRAGSGWARKHVADGVYDKIHKYLEIGSWTRARGDLFLNADGVLVGLARHNSRQNGQTKFPIKFCVRFVVHAVSEKRTLVDHVAGELLALDSDLKRPSY